MSSSSLYSSVSSTSRIPGAQLLSSAVLWPASFASASAPTPSPPALVVLSPSELVQLLPSLKPLLRSPVVLQVSTAASNGDHSAVTALRSTGLPLLYSANQQQADANALVAAHVAAQGRAVLHFGEFAADAISLGQHASVSQDWVRGAAAAAASSAQSNGKVANGSSNGHSHAASPADALLASFESAFGALPSSNAASAVTSSGSGSTVVLALGDVAALASSIPADVTLVSLNLYRPLSAQRIRQLVPSGTSNVVVLEQNYQRTAKWSPLFLDVVGAFADSDDEAQVPTILSATLGQVQDGNAAFKAIQDAVATGASPITLGTIPSPSGASASTSAVVVPPKHESTYTNLLNEVFGQRLWVANAPSSLFPSSSTSTISATSPEYALGHVLGAQKKREELRRAVREAVAAPGIEESAAKALTAWLQDDRSDKVVKAASDAAVKVASSSLREAQFGRKSNWIIGSETWSHDLGASGLHHALSTGADVNLLLIDTTPYALPGEGPTPSQRRKDAGLYAMTYGNAYVASVAVYGDFSQTLRAFAEADAYKGPSIILAYLPGGENDSTRALEILKQTKKAIEIGTWPLLI
ncbi:BZ3500_MvSof-1268-A1-R1_Chr2-3g05242 [Microbotryum saponariae]|uniref:BZ3500_MvSof-1268-A1-R1_Chr2-3g05242 protein n=1 Tax=Microbotryum saponariae TaxID=289078 RepID=A0A2X0M7Z2_9BASI|nr:BZ3500_MvSof-1268-A1-R1_Chr2-3g05242 [Microbotryum saponariae]SDA01068.1 BZ3501_MvSof-1269-A2-R1_Chr2-2g04915 [Microbotryum saponariae]